ncbi:MAG: PASTA domain-containing protein [Clostridia bacterium]|nr:PASTA domain-containing protein [Clostridia bacterium]
MKKDFSLLFQKRGLGLLACFTAVAILLAAVLFRMQIFGYEEYQQKVLEQITVGSALKADRGNIYDRNGNLLATNKTTWRIYISPVDIRASAKKAGEDEAKAIARGLADILGKDYETIYKKTQKFYRLDETIAKNVDKETCDRVLRFAMENGYTSMIHADATTTRYYNYDSFAAQVIGFTGGDNQGLFGLELFYDEYLSGTDGQYITAKDASGKDLPSGYVGYTPAKDGLSLITTLDLYIQKQLERVLADAAADAGAENRVSGIVMDVNSGGILAMATLPSYDLNNPYQLDEASLSILSSYTEGTEEYTAKKSELLYTMWNNKAITETYEPGSTFKIVTSAMGLECGVVCPTSPFSCSGAYRVGGVLIHCHKVKGHGALDFTLGLQQSCNPVFMQVGARVGAEKFYEYFEAFGYLKKTGIDLPSETGSIFHSLENIHEVELATASFGQRFNVSMIQQITAVAAVANGGQSVTPHLMERLVNEEGTTVLAYTQKNQTQIVGKETCDTISKILEEGVSGGNGVKNAYVCGYKIAAKTGTSEKLNGKRVGSCVAYAPADDPEIAVIIIVDEPTCAVKYGSVIAAPYVADLMENVLPYLGYTPQYTEEEAKLAAIPVGDYTGLSVSEAIKKIKTLGLSYEYGDGGSGDTVRMQVPAAGAKVSKNGGKIILYTEESATANAAVPDLLGKSGEEANRLLLDAGLNVLIEGAKKYDIGAGATVIGVSYKAGTQVPKGTVVTVTLRYMDGDESG